MKQNRWLRLIAGTVVFMALGLIYAWSIFRTPISSMFETWTFSQISLTFTISMISFCLSGMLSGKLYHRWGPVRILLIAAAVLAVGFWSASCMNTDAPKQSLILIYAAYGVCCGGGVGLAYNSLLSAILEWFSDRSGLASGILLMGFGIGGMLLGSGVTEMIRRIGLLPTFRILGCMMPLMVLLGAFLAKDRPLPVRKGGSSKGSSKTTADMLKEKYFWLMMLWLVILGSIGLLVVNSAATIVASFGAPEFFGLLVSVFNGAGRIVLGTVYDSFKGKAALFTNSALFIIAALLLCFGGINDSALLVVLGLALAGSGYGGNPTIASALVRDTYGDEHYSVNFAIVNLTMIPSSLIGPMVSSRLIELSGGRYDSTFYMVLLLALAALAVCTVMHWSPRKRY